MQISIVQHDHVTVVAVTGSIDALTADALVTALRDELVAGRTRLVAHFGAVEYTSSAGLRVLLTTLKDARQRGGDLRLSDIRPNVRQVLELSGFTSILKLTGSKNECVSRCYRKPYIRAPSNLRNTITFTRVAKMTKWSTSLKAGRSNC